VIDRTRPAAALALLLGLSFAPALASAESEWRMIRANPEGRAVLRLAGPGDGLRAWQYQAGSHIWGYQPGLSVWSSAALGTVGGRPLCLVGSYDSNIYALDALTGARRWRFTTGGGVYSTPAIATVAGKQMVFAGSSDRLLYALDADSGRRLWIYTVKAWRPTIGGARLSSPAVGRAGAVQAVFLGHWVWDKSLAGHLQAGGVSAVDASGGRQLWSTQLGDNQLSSPIFVVLPDGTRRIFIASENGNLYALDADSGKVLWSFTERNAIKASPAYFVGARGPRVVIGSKAGRVRCLDARNGAEVWSFKTSHWVDGSAAVGEVAGRQLVFVGSYDTNLYALEAESGAMRWSFRTQAGIYSSPALLRDQGKLHVLVASWDHHLYCVDAAEGRPLWKIHTGRPLWDSITLGDSIWASPVALELEGQRPLVVIGSYAGPLHAIPFAEAQGQDVLASYESNRDFWIRLPAVMLAVALLTLFLSRRQRRAIARSAPKTR
jgi:outer membrane protein assembly factor BamB